MYLNVRMIQYSSFQVQNFGEPFFLVVRENETLTEVKQRIQKKLMISDDEFSKVSVDQHLACGIYKLLCLYMGLFHDCLGLWCFEEAFLVSCALGGDSERGN